MSCHDFLYIRFIQIFGLIISTSWKCCLDLLKNVSMDRVKRGFPFLCFTLILYILFVLKLFFLSYIKILLSYIRGFLQVLLLIIILFWSEENNFIRFLLIFYNFSYLMLHEIPVEFKIYTKEKKMFPDLFLN